MRRELKRLEEVERKKEGKKKEERVPTLAEMSLSAAELRRLRTVGIELKKKVRVGKAGITEGIVNGIHENWRRSEVVKLVCEDLCRLNMKRTHDLLEVRIRFRYLSCTGLLDMKIVCLQCVFTCCRFELYRKCDIV